MNMPIDTVEQRKLRSITRRYERDGYRVTVPRQGESVPAFLRNFVPDLIAESEHDRVIIEVKRSDAVRGSNELKEIAENVSREPGWRFELVTFPSVEQIAVPTAERMNLIESHARKAMSVGLTDLAYMYVWGTLEQLLNDLAVQHGIKMVKVPFLQAARDLVSRGIIPREAFDVIEQVRIVRNRLVHGKDDILLSDADIEELFALGRRLQSEIGAAATS